MSEPTKCCLLTGVGRAAIAVVAVDGPDAQRCLLESFRPANDRPFADAQVRYGTWCGAQSGDADPAESVVVVPVLRSRSAQSETLTRFEIHCHGGVAAAERLLCDLESLGVLRDQSSNVFDADPHFGSDDPFIRQAIDVMLRCTTQRTAAIAMQQVNGAFVRWRDACRQKLDARQQAMQIHPNLTSQDSNDRVEALHTAAEVAKEAAGILLNADLGRHLTVPWNIVLAGPPNVGKSSLINAIVGFDRSITMDLPGTTRDVLDAETVVDGWPLRLRDTAGVRETNGSQESHQAIEREGITRARIAMEDADLIVSVTEPGMEELVLAEKSTAPVIHVRNKVDLINDSVVPPPPSAGLDFVDTVATTGQGVSLLLQEIQTRLIGESFKPDQPVPVCESQVRWLEQIVATENDFGEMCSLFKR